MSKGWDEDLCGPYFEPLESEGDQDDADTPDAEEE